MELFLNLCWLALLLPAYLLWERRGSPDHSARTSLVFACTVGCVLVLLFPVISASDDLHSIGQAMEESKPSLHGGVGSRVIQSVAHSSLLALPASAFLKAADEQAGNIVAFSTNLPATFFASHRTARAPPLQLPVSQI